MSLLIHEHKSFISESNNAKHVVRLYFGRASDGGLFLISQQIFG